MSKPSVLQYLPRDSAPGSFTQNNMDQNVIIWENIKHVVLKAVDECVYESRKGEPFRVAELGANEGGTSALIMAEIIDSVRVKYGKDTEMEIIYEDQPCNNFNSLFLLSNGLAPGPNHILLQKQNVFISAVGRSFHERCFPSGTIHLVISANAVHHLSKGPCSNPDTFQPMLLPVNDPVFMKCASQAREDWEAFLLHRARELVSGGVIVLAAFCQVTHPSKPEVVDFANRPAVGAIDGFWKKMANQGLITKEEYESANAWLYMCSVSEFKAPFDDPTSPVIKAGLRLLSIKQHVTAVTKYDDLPRKEAAKHNADHIRSFLSWPFLTALAQRSEHEKHDLVDQLFRGYEEELVHNDSIAPVDLCHAHIVIKKI